MRPINYLRKIYISFFSTLSSIHKGILWERSISKCRKWIEIVPQVSLSTNSNCLILMPHSDDEWIGCSQIIKKWKNVSICNMDMPGGDVITLHKQRLEECSSLSKDYHRNFVTLSSHKEQSLEDCITGSAAEVIMVPYFIDWHPEHVEVMSILYRVLDRIEYKGIILMYQVSIPIPAEECNYCIPMDKKDMNDKWKVFKQYYKTQSCIPIQRFMANERINGAIVTSYAAEAFSMVCNVKQWQEKYGRLLLTEDETKLLKNRLDDICFVREKVKQLFKEKSLS